jgi:hypothetical protein
MPLAKGFAPSVVSKNIHELTHHGSRPRPHDQIVAIALSEADKSRREHAAFGGGMGMMGGGMGGGYNPMLSYEERSAIRGEMSDQFHPTGLIGGAGAGRTDRLPLSVAAESHIIPSDVVSSLGQGTTANGAAILNGIIKGGVGPYGVAMPRGARGSGVPRPPAAPKIVKGLAKGGETPDEPEGVSHILAASGEFVVDRSDVARIGARQRRAGLSKARTDLRAGHQALDDLILRVRKHTLRWLKNAPRPRK